MYKELGFHLEKNLFSKHEIDQLKNQFIKVFRTYTKDATTNYDQLIVNLYREDIDGFIGCADACQNLVELYRISVDDRIINTLKKLGLAWPQINTRPLVSFSSPLTAKNENYWKIPAHQDWPSTQGSINGITCWVPLCDVDRPLGPLEISPRSHLDGLLEHIDNGVPHLETDKYEFVSIEMSQGDALFFSNFTVHKSGTNITERIRLTTHFRYNDIEEKTFVARKFPRHRIDKRKEGFLFPGFPTKKEVEETFKGVQN